MEQDLNVWRKYMSALAAAREAANAWDLNVDAELTQGREWLKLVGEVHVEKVSIDAAEKTTLREWLSAMVGEQPTVSVAA